MKKGMFRSLSAALLLLLGMAMPVACTSDVAELAPSETESSEMHTAKMNLQLSMTPFDAHSGTRASDGEWVWPDGATVYIQFQVNGTLLRGHAVYSQKTDSWNASYAGQIGTSGKCTIYYFDGASTSNKSSVALNSEIAIYEDPSATYLVGGNVVTLTGALAPKTSRLRFTGASGVAASVEGIQTYVGYDADKNEFKTSTAPVIRIVGDNGSTSYIYGVFAKPEVRELIVENNVDDKIFSKICGSSAFIVGESGYMTLPTEDTNKGWPPTTPDAEKVITVVGSSRSVNLTMKRVSFGTVLMGQYNTEDGNFVPNAHRVYLSSFYLGATEVTNALWETVMGSKPKYQRNDGDEYPVSNISWEMITGSDGFLEKLNALTGLNFRLPTEAEWEFAAKGGRKSKGYALSGGNTPDDVAWYSANSDDTTHPVAQKAANELGLYDMSGNVAEWCYDYWASYSTGLQYNPVLDTRLNSDNHVTRGGSFYHNYDAAYVARRNSAGGAATSFTLGFRIAL